MSKSVIKYFLQVLVLVVVGAAIFFGIGFYRYYSSPEYRKVKELEALKERYMADTYGGNTPEETLELFIDALKAGDIDLAAKYFVLDKQEEMGGYLMGLKNKGELSKAINDVQRLKLSKNSGEQAFFTIANSENIVEVQVILGKSPNNKWKLLDI